MRLQVGLGSAIVVGFALASSGQSAERLFFGVGSDPLVGMRAVVLCANVGAGIGRFWAPPRFLEMTSLKVDPSRTLSFETAPGWEGVFRFSGDLSGSEMRGKLSISRIPAAKSNREWEIVASDMTSSRERVGQGSVRLSNAVFSPQGADIVGVDLEILPGKSEPRGVIVFYESYWYEKTKVPHAITAVTQEGSTIRFEIRTLTGPIRYHVALLGQNAAVLYRDDQGPKAEGVDLRVGGPPLVSCDNRSVKPVR